MSNCSQLFSSFDALSLEAKLSLDVAGAVEQVVAVLNTLTAEAHRHHGRRVAAACSLMQRLQSDTINDVNESRVISKLRIASLSAPQQDISNCS